MCFYDSWTLCCCRCCCNACGSCCKAPAKAMDSNSPNTNARIGYVIFQIFWILFTILLMYILKWTFYVTTSIDIGCPKATGGTDSCLGASLLIRMSFALALCHTIIFIVLMMRNDMAATFYEKCWCLKFLIVLGMLIGSLWIPNNPMYYGYLQFSQWTSFFFLVFQGMLMLIVAYVINEILLRNVEREGGSATSCSGIILISLTFLLFGGNVTWIVFQFIEFGQCPFNATQMIITCIVGAAMYALVIVRTRSDASVFTSSLVLTYCLYLQWSAFSSGPNTICNPYTSSAFNTSLLMAIGLAFTFVSLLVISAVTFKQE